MPFISRSILLDLPFNQPDEKNKQEWLDASGKGYSAIANSNCEASTLDFLGNCLRLNAGGELTLPKFDLPTRTQFFSQLEQLTLEFWAKPDASSNSEASTTKKHLLRGPINVWMQGNDLCWRIGNKGTDPVHTINNVGDQLHHWAIVLNRTVDSATITFFQDGVENTDYTTELSITPEQLGAIANTDFVIGATSDGWTGRLAHLRLWDTALNATQLQENKNRDITAHSAFKAANGIDWRLVNADDEPTLYIHSNRPQELRLEIENITQETTLSLPANPDNASLDNSHIWLVFRPGTLASALLPSPSSSPSSSANSSGSDRKFVQDIRNSNPDWDVSIAQWNGHDCIVFLRQESTKTLKPGERLTLYIPNVAAEAGPGSRPTQVMLKYQHLEIGADVGNASAILDGHRAQVINILYRNPASFYRKPPLEVGVVGAPVILNNGQEETSLTLYIKNFKRDEDSNSDKLILGNSNNSSTDSTSPTDKEPKFILEIDQTQTGSRFIETSLSELSVREQFWYQDNSYTLTKKEVLPAILRGTDDKAGERRLSPPPSHVLLLQEKRLLFVKNLNPGDIFLHEGDYFQFEHWDIYRRTSRVYKTQAKVFVRNGPPINCRLYSRVTAWRSSTQVPVEALKKGDKFWEEGESICLDFEDYIPLRLEVTDKDNNTQFLSPVPRKVHKQEDFPLDGFGDSDDLNQTNVEKTDPSSDINIQKMDSSGSTLRWKILPPEVTVKPSNSSITESKKRGFHPDETIFLTVADLKTSAPAGRGMIRLRYEDFDKYGEGVFEIPIEKSPVIPARLKQGGAGFGLALGHDPRVQKEPNAEVLDEMLSIKQVGNGSAVKVDNAGSGSGLIIENAGEGSGLAVTQSGTGLAAQFTGGSGVKISNKLTVEADGAEISGKLKAKDDAEIANKLVVKGGGAEITGKFTAKNDAEITGNLTVGQRIQDKTGEVMPVGAVLPFAGGRAPKGWALCTGRLVNEPKYADLAKVLGKTLPFHLPNYQEKFLVGAKGSGDYKLGETGGQKMVKLSTKQMPRHKHNVSAKYSDKTLHHEHVRKPSHKPPRHGSTYEYWLEGSDAEAVVKEASQGDGEAHENRPPFVALNYIVKY